MNSIQSDLFLLDNPYFSAGAGLIGIGTFLAILKQGSLRSTLFLKRQLLTTLELNSKDRAFSWILPYISLVQKEDLKKRKRSLLNHFFPSSKHYSVQTTFIQRENGATESYFTTVPAPGIHFFKWKGSWIKVERVREKFTSDITSGVPFETLTLTMLANQEKSGSIFQSLLDEAKLHALKACTGKTLIFTSWANEWRQFGPPRNKRPLSSVILEDGVCEKILADVKEFISSSKWYLQRGIPYRRGYLLYGPPGTGKSSFIMALAGVLNYNICLINLAENIMTDDRLQYLFSVVPERSIILLEDIDAAFVLRNISTATPGKVTFSGLLNAIDGVASSEERIIFMTTNHIEKLDSALLRPGRVDLQQYIGNVTLNQVKKMFLQFYPTVDTSIAEMFISTLRHQLDLISPAMIQGHFIQFKNSPMDAINNPISLN